MKPTSPPASLLRSRSTAIGRMRGLVLGAKKKRGDCSPLPFSHERKQPSNILPVLPGEADHNKSRWVDPRLGLALPRQAMLDGTTPDQ